MTTPPSNDWLEEVLRDIWSLAVFGLEREYTNADEVYDAHPDYVKASKAAIQRHILDLRIQDAEKLWAKVVPVTYKSDNGHGNAVPGGTIGKFVADLRTQR